MPLQPALRPSLSLSLPLLHPIPRPAIIRRFHPTAHTHHRARRSATDETTLASAKHKPSLSGPSLGHLLSELSATTPEMLRAGLRREGQTMEEEHRTLARKVAVGVVGVPLAFGGVVVGGVWLWAGGGDGGR